MRKFYLLFLLSATAFSQPAISSWMLNHNGETASYWENTSSPGQQPTYVFHTTTVLADVLSVCATSDYVYTTSEGMTDNMGKFMNPGGCEAQGYTFKFPLAPAVPTTKVISPKEGPIGLLLNGIPIFGLSNANSWNGSSNVPQGSKIWNVEVYKSEGFVLDTAFAAHPQQQGAYHSHATPWRLFKNTPITQHSPLVGFAFDGYPIYGPYGYSSATDATSPVARMTSGYSLRNITTRHTLADGTALTTAQYGPNVSTTYPIGTYCEDYEWLSSNNGSLDKYNGRFCVTPEYPGGTYAYFVTMDAASIPQFPYYIGIQYYGSPIVDDITPNTTITVPTTGTTCFYPLGTPNNTVGKVSVYPNPSSGIFNLSLPNVSGKSFVEVYDMTGKLLFSKNTDTDLTEIDLSGKTFAGTLLIKVTNNGKQYSSKILLK